MSQPNPVRALSCNREAEHESGADWIVIGSRSVACRPPGQILGSASRVAEDSSKCSGAGACARPDLRSLSLHLVDMCRSGAGDLAGCWKTPWIVLTHDPLPPIFPDSDLIEFSLQIMPKGDAMRGDEEGQEGFIVFESLEDRVPLEHPLRSIRRLVDKALREMSPLFDSLYAEKGRVSIPPECLLRALVLQTLYGIPSERKLCEHLEYNLLFRWFVGLPLSEKVWHPTTFTKNRDRLLEHMVMVTARGTEPDRAAAESGCGGASIPVERCLGFARTYFNSHRRPPTETPRQGDNPQLPRPTRWSTAVPRTVRGRLEPARPPAR